MLGNLADNGGQTNTLALINGSPAIDNADQCVINGQCSQLPNIFIRGSFDQRRYDRRVFNNNQVDIGAVEHDGSNASGSASFSFGFFTQGPVTRFANSLVILTNIRTLEKRYSFVRITGRVSFSSIPTNDAYVMEIKSKRKGLPSPLVVTFDR